MHTVPIYRKKRKIQLLNYITIWMISPFFGTNNRNYTIWNFLGRGTHGTLQSILSSDINIFMVMVFFLLTETEDKWKSAIVRSRFECIVDKLWPRVQVKMYGSHVSNLRFRLCHALPAVHRAFLPSKPGVLEGRNAIKESSKNSSPFARPNINTSSIKE